MFSRLFTLLSTFLAMTAAYWLYAFLVVPLVEPSVTIVESITSAADLTPGRRPYEDLFPEGSWERDHPKVVLTEQGALFIKDYRAVDEQRLELKPCTLVFYAGGKDGGEPGRPVILQAPEGAIVQFDGGANLTRAKLGRLVAARLTGEITIRSPPSTPSADDELLITTRNVQMDERRVWTPHEVRMRFGPNIAVGSDLIITLNNTGPRLTKLKDGIKAVGIKSMELVHLEKLSLQVPSKGNPLGGPSFLSKLNQLGDLPVNKQEQAAQTIPVEVTCSGPFKLDLEKRFARFDDRVEVVCLKSDGPGDQLSCGMLEIHFLFPSAGARPDANATTGEREKKGWAIEPERIVAVGFPAMLRIPSLGALVRGNKLEYNLKTHRVHLEDKNGAARIQDSRAEIESPSMEYEILDDGRLGHLFATGPGYCKVKLEDGDRTVEASWNDQISIQPHEQNKVISLRRDARLAIRGMGELTGDELHFYLLEVQQPTSAANTSTAAKRVTIVPDRMLGRGNIQLTSAKLTDRSDELRVWFRQPPPGAKSTHESQAKSVPPLFSKSIQQEKGSSSGLPSASFDLTGRLVEVEVVLGEPMVVDRATISGGVKFEQVGGKRPGESFIMTGDVVQYEQGATTNPEATITGTPAKISARGMTLLGAKIQLHQGENSLKIEDAGEMHLPAGGRSLSQGITVGEKPVVVVWQNGMHFDGQTATFSGNVNTNGTFLLRTGQSMKMQAQSGTLDVVLSKRIDFLNAKPSADLTARLFEFRDGVRLSNLGLNKDGNQDSIDELHSPNLSIDQLTGDIHSEGAGRVSSIRRGGNALSKTPTALRSISIPSRQLTYLETDFRHGIRGNLNHRELHFLGDVHTIYGPVEDWTQRLDPRAARTAGQDSITLSCHELAVREMGTIQDPKQPDKSRAAFELEAWGNAEIRGQEFRAQAEHLAYTEAKDQFVLEGTGRTSAILDRFPSGGGAPAHLAARKIMFWPSTNAFDIEDAQPIKVPNLKQYQRGKAAQLTNP